MNPYHSSFQYSLWQLQFTFTPEAYHALFSRYISSWEWLSTDTEIDTYWAKLPTYLIARCPICGTEYYNRADTHSYFFWRNTTPETSRSAFPHPENAIPCRHFVGVQRFVNLNKHLPVEINYGNNMNGDIPVMTPELVEHDSEASAVIHSLPICRIENNQFVPKYSVYLLSYFAPSPSVARHALLSRYPATPGDGYPMFCVSGNHSQEPRIIDLLYWVERKKLLWLDLHDQTLPLRSAPLSDFPYAGISGFGTPWIYRKTPKPRWGGWIRRWSPNGEIRDWRGRRLQ